MAQHWQMTIILADLSRPAHGEAVLHLLGEYAGDIMGGGQELDPFTKDHLVEELNRLSTCHVVLAYDGDLPIGLAICFEGFSTFACRKILNIHDFAVVAGYRGRGVARRMLEKVEEVASDLECCKLTLEVLEGNEVAQRVYQRFGFEGYELDPKMGRALFFEKKIEA